MSERIWTIIAVIYAISIIAVATLLVCVYDKRRPAQYTGQASWYFPNHSGLVAAMWDVPKGSIMRVTNIENNRRVEVKIVERGPAKYLVRQGRIIDLGHEAFAKIAHPSQGLIPVLVERIK